MKSKTLEGYLLYLIEQSHIMLRKRDQEVILIELLRV